MEKRRLVTALSLYIYVFFDRIRQVRQDNPLLIPQMGNSGAAAAEGQKHSTDKKELLKH